MKKQLLCTSAIALGVAAAAPASAQSWDLDWGGYMNQHVAWSDSSGVGLAPGTDYDGIDTFNNSEIHFTPSITLDNGLTFGVNIQLEGNLNGGGFIDESYMTISGDSFGKLVVGNENSAGYLSMVAAPQVTSMYINSPSISGFLPITAAGVGSGFGAGFVFRDAKYSAYTEVAGNNDVNRISYYTPNFNGLTLGVSYAATGNVNTGNNFSNNRNATVSDIFDIGINYSGTIGGIDLNAGARWGTADAPSVVGLSDPETWGIGATIGFGGFTVGGSYAENDNGGNLGAGVLGVGSGVDSEGWTFGATYDAPGPWSFEILTSQGESDSVAVLGGHDDYEAYQIGAARDLGPGVSWNVYAIWLEGDQAGTIGTDLDGTVIGTAINLSF